MTAAGASLMIGFAIATAIGLVVIVRDHRRRVRHGRMPRGTAPGRGDTILHGNERTFLGDGLEDASRGYRVTRDPQRYAQAFVPRGRKDR